MVKIAFYTPQIDVRGSCVALYDYAYYSEEILKNTSVVVTPKNANNDLIALLKFTNRFPVFFYENVKDLHKILQSEGCDILYTIKYGKKDEIVFDDIKTVVHCVFDLSEPHGAVYAAVSKTLAQKYNYPLYVPHMVGLQPSATGENMRRELGIPEDVIVFGRHGGMDTFNIPFVHNAIRKLVRQNKKLYFLFMNTPRFDDHPQVIFVEPTVDISEKNRFIQTCDAHLECGTLGHSFGLSIAEFSVNNKPIIAFKGDMWNTSHIDILGDKALYFTTSQEFESVVTSFNPKTYQTRDNNCYKDFSPQKVMKIFDEVFIQGALKAIP